MVKVPEGKKQQTVYIEENTHKQAKKLALELDISISEVYATGVKMMLEKHKNLI